jgi:hypothetical protein
LIGTCVSHWQEMFNQRERAGIPQRNAGLVLRAVNTSQLLFAAVYATIRLIGSHTAALLTERYDRVIDRFGRSHAKACDAPADRAGVLRER